MREQNKHKKRDNKFGVTWCVSCGRLFTKPCGIELKKEDINRYKFRKK